MRSTNLIRWLASALLILISCTAGGGATNNGKQTVVEWDSYSLIINNERIFIFGGEFHYLRLPVPELWLDVFQKLRANGFNAVSLYFFWNFHSASEGVFDFETGAHDVQKVFDYAQEAGIYVIARAGPYINAELSAGGFALWATNGQLGKERTSDETYYEAWLPWIEQIGAIIADNQITNGGPVILHQHENELTETTHSANNTLVLYMEQITAAFDAAGVIIPSTHNEKGERGQSWSTDYEDVGGAVNIYGLDSYPGGLSCTNPSSGFNVLRNYYQWFQNYSYTQPEYFPEFEGGYFTPWGGSFYGDCESELSPEFADVYYKNNIGQRTTLQSLYMAYGGTNWGHTGAPVVYTSYDYSAPMSESREIRDKLRETKLVGLFTRASTDLLKTDMEDNGTAYTSDDTIWTWVLRNPDTGAGFYHVAHETTSSTTVSTFDLAVSTSEGNISIPDITLDGRQSKFVVTDYQFGDHTLLFSSAEVLTYSVFDVDVIVLYLIEGQIGHFAFADSDISNSSFTVYGSTNISATSSSSNSSSYFTYTQAAGTTVVELADGTLMYLLDKATAWDFFAVPTTINPAVGADEQVFVIGPYLVRTAEISGGELILTGDSMNTTDAEIYAGANITSVTWNSQSLSVSKTAYGSLKVTIPGSEDTQIILPTLGDWKSNNTIPEISPSYDDSKWTLCNHTTTLSPVAPLTLPVLYSSDYGYHSGIKLYRSQIPTSSSENTTATITAINITAQNGVAAGWSAYLEGTYIGGAPGNASLATTSALLDLTSASNTTTNSTTKTLTVIVDYTGHDEDSVKPSGAQNPRGLLGANPFCSDGTSGTSCAVLKWKIQGNAGGEANIDPLRGPMNEGGLYGERLGWHLPGFDTIAFADLDPTSDGVEASGARFFITTFDLDVPDTIDVPIGLQLSAAADTIASVQIFINGYNYGHYLPHIGPQTVFPFQPGLLDMQGSNTLALSVWALEDSPVVLETVELVMVGGVYESGFGPGFGTLGSTLRTGWSAGREQYA